MQTIRGYETHISHLQRATGVDDSASLMERRDRLAILLRVAEPVYLDTPHLLEGGPYSWSKLLCNIVGIGSDIWWPATDLELEGRTELVDIVFDWLGMGCWSEPEREPARRLNQRIQLLAEKLN